MDHERTPAGTGLLVACPFLPMFIVGLLCHLVLRFIGRARRIPFAELHRFVRSTLAGV